MGVAFPGWSEKDLVLTKIKQDKHWEIIGKTKTIIAQKKNSE